MLFSSLLSLFVSQSFIQQRVGGVQEYADLKYQDFAQLRASLSQPSEGTSFFFGYSLYLVQLLNSFLQKRKGMSDLQS
jgi:hypothetical protein